MTKTKNKVPGAGARLKAHLANREEQLVDVRCPSGFVYRLVKPSKYTMLFAGAGLPQAAVSAAVEQWQKDGLIDPPDMDEATELQFVENAFNLRDRVLELSREPKIVLGEPTNDNEISAHDVPDEDLDFLFQFVAAGGDGAAKLRTFSERRGPDPLVSRSRKVRHKAK